LSGPLFRFRLTMQFPVLLPAAHVERAAVPDSATRRAEPSLLRARIA
jgi:hypothetical protein